MNNNKENQNNNLNEDTLIEILEKSVDLGDIDAAAQLLYLYTQEDYLDIYRAKTLYYQLLQMCDNIDSRKSTIYFAFKHIFDFYYSNGYYVDAKEISYITLKSVAAKWTLDALLTIGIPVEGSTEEEKLKLKSRQEEQCNYAKLIETALENCDKKLKELSDSSQRNKCILIDAGFDEKVIDKMTDQEKVFISTSFKTYEFVNKENKNSFNLDYSATTISIYKAVELMLEKLFNKYLEYLKNNEKTLDLSKIDKYLKCKSGGIKFKFGTEFTCGKVLDFIGKKFKKYKTPTYYEQYYEPHIYFCNFCESCGINKAEPYVKNMINDMQQIIKLRNETAHRASVSKEEAKQTFDILVDVTKFINKIYTDFNKVI